MKIIFKSSLFCFGILFFSGCATYLFSSDEYALGSRWLDRKMCPEALQYLQPLSDKGDCDAEYKMGFMYFTGTCKSQDDKLSIEYLNKAANQGQPKAAIILGNLHYQKPNDLSVSSCPGCKIKKDLVEAMKWYRLAEKNSVYDGEKEFVKRVSAEILPQLSEVQKAEVEKRVNAFSYNPTQCKPRKFL